MEIRPDGTRDRIESWKAIAAFLGRDVRTVQRWESHRGLPVHRLNGSGRGAVYVLVEEIERWRTGSSGRRKIPEVWWYLLAAAAGGAVVAASLWLLTAR